MISPIVLVLRTISRCCSPKAASSIEILCSVGMASINERNEQPEMHARKGKMSNHGCALTCSLSQPRAGRGFLFHWMLPGLSWRQHPTMALCSPPPPPGPVSRRGASGRCEHARTPSGVGLETKTHHVVSPRLSAVRIGPLLAQLPQAPAPKEHLEILPIGKLVFIDPHDLLVLLGPGSFKAGPSIMMRRPSQDSNFVALRARPSSKKPLSCVRSYVTFRSPRSRGELCLCASALRLLTSSGETKGL